MRLVVVLLPSVVGALEGSRLLQMNWCAEAVVMFHGLRCALVTVPITSNTNAAIAVRLPFSFALVPPTFAILATKTFDTSPKCLNTRCQSALPVNDFLK